MICWSALPMTAAFLALSMALQSAPVPAPPSAAQPPAAAESALDAAQRLYYNGRYEAAAELMRAPCASEPDAMAACELRSAAIHFQIKRALGDATDKGKAWKACGACPALLTAFQTANVTGLAKARARLAAHPDEESTLFLLSKLGLTHVWLHLGTLGRKTGWDEYWEARRSLDTVLKQHPGNVRAKVARAWVDYIVDTKMPRGTRWLLGGGNKKRGLLAVRDAMRLDAAPFAKAEARFALWDMQVREGEVPQAIATARLLARDFSENRELRKFLTIHDSTTLVINPARRVP
jgi:hypothetical protein